MKRNKEGVKETLNRTHVLYLKTSISPFYNENTDLRKNNNSSSLNI